MPELVICRSDHDYVGTPLAFYWQTQRVEVDEVIAQARSPTGYRFRVRSREFGIFELIYDQIADQWSIQRL